MILGDLGATIHGLLLAASPDMVMQTSQDHIVVSFLPGGRGAETDSLPSPPELWPSAVRLVAGCMRIFKTHLPPPGAMTNGGVADRGVAGVP